MEDLSRSANDAGSLAWCVRLEQEPSLRLQTRTHNLVWVCRERGGHLGDRRAKQYGVGRQGLVRTVTFCGNMFDQFSHMGV